MAHIFAGVTSVARVAWVNFGADKSGFWPLIQGLIEFVPPGRRAKNLAGKHIFTCVSQSWSLWPACRKKLSVPVLADPGAYSTVFARSPFAPMFGTVLP